LKRLPYRVTRVTLVSLLLAAATTSFAQQGVRKLDPPQPVMESGIVEVIEFFAYGCGAVLRSTARLTIGRKSSRRM